MLILFFGDYWDKSYRRRQSIAIEFANLPTVSRVVYIERPISLGSLLNTFTGRGDAKSSTRWKRIFKQGISSCQEKVYVISPLIIHGKGLLSRATTSMFSRLSNRYIYKLAKKYCEEQIVLWISMPDVSADLINALKREFRDIMICYDKSEDIQRLGSLNLDGKISQLNEIKENEDFIISMADIIFINSKEYFQDNKFNKENLYLLSNGVSDNYLNYALKEQICHKLKGFHHPIIGYTGSINWHLDIQLYKYIAQSRPMWSLVLMGNPVNRAIMKVFKEQDNIHYFNEVPLKELPAYISNFDVCINFLKENKVNNSGTSLKLLNYLALGKPIVSSNTAGASQYADVLYLASTPEEFLRKIEEALNEKDLDLINKRKRIANEQSWSKKIKEVHDLMISFFASKP
jgi:glycosyltransferase involved in cell wall biosynthesis